MAKRKTDMSLMIRIINTLTLFILLGALCLVFTSGCAPKKGDQGATGVAPSIIATPADLEDCDNGGVVVEVGSVRNVVCNGDKGATGETGSAGTDGQDGTLINIVPLCQGTSDYGTFVEIALCIDNKLWAVYSENNGFLTYLAPGNYASNAHGSSCSLTVGPNCQVTH